MLSVWITSIYIPIDEVVRLDTLHFQRGLNNQDLQEMEISEENLDTFTEENPYYPNKSNINTIVESNHKRLNHQIVAIEKAIEWKYIRSILFRNDDRGREMNRNPDNPEDQRSLASMELLFCNECDPWRA